MTFLTGVDPPVYLLFYNDADIVAVVSLMIENLSANLSKKSIVRSEADVLARMNLCSVLTDKNLTTLDDLTTVTLHSETLCIRISSVL